MLDIAQNYGSIYGFMNRLQVMARDDEMKNVRYQHFGSIVLGALEI